ncbi:hypothetical protein [Methylobacterium haplocladii]|uniref:Uncharacterized protein n=1 Tax=Methylobacterium haplocladii TaxID=1176176 RepID=A0A512IKJ3_9HYPH|nr:hypothetical protein [Methylobacterium haplocladii]GEO98226.1 hypothetical protein MHA02_06140 [Methylobacterium haplocladii]GJD84379.1 hypothetical protein HPGCJGGD_2255 [Methylobacterium haplocladii]GLS59990.1 hypothetical protein GCM10007887_26660 [Methylobacterium haplocladii]
MRKLAALTVLALTLAGPALAQGRDPNSSSAASGNAEENNKPKSNSSGGGGQ